jgi:hypothetical protein
MRIERFEDIDPPALWRIEAWQPVESLKVERLARELTHKVYDLTKKTKFDHDFGLKGQIQGAAGSPQKCSEVQDSGLVKINNRKATLNGEP